MTALFAHVENLRDRCDQIFLPFYLDQDPTRRGSGASSATTPSSLPAWVVGSRAGERSKEDPHSPGLFSLREPP